jgi:cold shock CspA family protein
MRGTVEVFDEERGLGTVTLEDGRELGFHCTAIADGTRTIAVGTAVEVDVVPGHLGHWEADRLRPAS